MRNAIKALGALYSVVLVLSALAPGQNLQTGAPSAASGPNYDLSIGYADLITEVPKAGRVNLYGLDAGGQIHLTARWGAAVDSSYARSFNVPGTPRDDYILGLHGGPVFYPVEHGNTRMFVHALAGADVEDGAIPISAREYLHGWLLRSSYLMGGGIEHPFLGPMALRLSGDYLRNHFFGSADTVQPQNNLRITLNLVFHSRRPYSAGR
jgi:hypothetical protein